MLGLIQRLLFKLIDEQLGEQAVVELKRRAGIPEDKYYEMGLAYPDEEWQRLFEVAREMTGLTIEQAEHAYARVFLDDAIRRWPTWFNMARSSRDLLKLQPLIHNSFASGVVDPTARRVVEDKFNIEERPESLIIHYRSVNRLCGLYKCLAHRVADHYNEDIELTEPLCLKRGDTQCEVHVRFLGGRA